MSENKKVMKTEKKTVHRILSKFKDILCGPESLRKYSIMFLIFLAIALLLEIFVCNFRAIESLTFGDEIMIENYKVENAKKISDGTYTCNGKDVSIKIENFNKEFDNVYLGITGINPYTKFTISVIDEANAAKAFTAPEREVVNNVEQSKYIRTHFSGTVKSMTISLKNMEDGSNFHIDGIGVNRRVPMCFTWYRFLFILCVMMFLYTFRPGSFVYKHRLNLKVKWQLIAIVLFLIVQTICMWNLKNANPYIRDAYSTEANLQYNHLAESLLHGRFDLEIDTYDDIKALDNPYDYSLRRSKLEHWPLWDNAYYNGRYYVYFGVVPCILFYVPFKLFSDGDLSNAVVLFICTMLMCLSFVYLLYKLAKKWFPRIPFGLYFIISILMCETCGALYFMKRPEFYPIPLALGVAFACTGLALWIGADYKDSQGNTKLKTWRIALGAVCLALIAGCRPQLLLSSVIGVVILWRFVFKDRLLFSKKSIKDTIALCLPYVIVAVLLMIYNFKRFGSPFDFGAAYNMTYTDMTHRGFYMDRTLTGFFYYLFQPCQFDIVFPYLKILTVNTLNQGYNIVEGTYGGFLWMSPIVFFGLWGLGKKKWYARKVDKRPYYISWALCLCAIAIVFIDTQMGGIIVRYFYDFAWMFTVAAAIAIFAAYTNISPFGKGGKEQKKALLTFVLVCFVAALVINNLQIFLDAYNSIEKTNPGLFYKMKYIMGFLL